MLHALSKILQTLIIVTRPKSLPVNVYNSYIWGKKRKAWIISIKTYIHVYKNTRRTEEIKLDWFSFFKNFRVNVKIFCNVIIFMNRSKALSYRSFDV